MSRAKGCSLSYCFRLPIENDERMRLYSLLYIHLLDQWFSADGSPPKNGLQVCSDASFECSFGQQIFNFFFNLHKDVVPASSSRDQVNQTNSEVSRCLSASISGAGCALNVWWEFPHFIFIYFLIILGACASSILASRRPLHVQYQPLCGCERCVSASVHLWL